MLGLLLTVVGGCSGGVVGEQIAVVCCRQRKGRKLELVSCGSVEGRMVWRLWLVVEVGLEREGRRGEIGGND